MASSTMLTTGKRVLIFSLAYFPVEGGAEIAVKQITDRLPDVEFDLITKRFDQSHQSFEKVGNVGVYRINSPKFIFPIKAFFKANKLNKLRSYDIAWSIMAAYAGLAGLFFKNKFPGAKLVLTLQEGDSLEHIKSRMGPLEFLFKRIFKRADVVQAISNFLADWGRNMGAKDVVVIPNGVDVSKFKVQSSKFKIGDKITLITTSRLVEKNAVGDIIESLKYLPENVHLKILGTGPLEIDCKLKIENWKLEGRVEMLGHVGYGDIPKHLHQADIFIRPSLSEGFGNSFIEAMAAGIPVIATPVGGIPDFLENGITGLFCEPGNPESIAEQVKKLVEDDTLRHAIVNNAIRMVEERYDWDSIAREMNDKVFSTL